MSVNSSSFNSSLYPLTNTCFRSEMSIYVFSTISTMNLLLFPVFVLVLYLGYQQQKQERSISTAAKSHSNLFTYHTIVMQLNEFLGLCLLFCGGYVNITDMVSVGQCLLKFASTGQSIFFILTCVEHYLAVVHPIIYLHLKQAGEVRIRNISVGCVWLLSFGRLVVYYVVSYELSLVLYLCVTVIDLIVISFCSISVLYTLKRPGPGEVGGNKEQVDQSKQRAFYTILAIMGVLLFRFVGNRIVNLIYSSIMVSSNDFCMALMSTVWLDLPGSLVLPLLFLHRAGKVQYCKQNPESG